MGENQKSKKGEPLYIDHFEAGGFRPLTGRKKKEFGDMAHRMWICLPAQTGRALNDFLNKTGIKRSHLIVKLLNAFLNSETAKKLLAEAEKESVE